MLVAIFVMGCVAQESETRTAADLESVRNQASLLLAFLQKMPKGGDLHLHLEGAGLCREHDRACPLCRGCRCHA